MNLDVKGAASDIELAALVVALTNVLNQQTRPTWRETRRKALGMHRGA
jgi:hypothetical protein